GYFIGLAITGQSRKYAVAPIGIGIAAILHGLNDWNPVNAHAAWVLVTLISVLLFLAYARAGAWLPQQAAGVPEQASPYGYTAPWPVGHTAPPSGPPSGPPGVPAGYGHSGVPAAPAAAGPGGPPGAPEVWWQPAAGHRPGESRAPRSPAPQSPAPQAPPPPPPPGRRVPAGAGAGPQDRAAPHAAAAQNSATLPTTRVEPRPRPKPWWEQ
ncbi:MAG TPA: hypothetical protein VGH88_13125, partial [Streptosporangiaceae bacterium]